MFDIARARASKSADGRITAKVVPRQVYLSCHNCKGIIGNELANAGNNTTILGPLGQVLMGPMIGPQMQLRFQVMKAVETRQVPVKIALAHQMLLQLAQAVVEYL